MSTVTNFNTIDFKIPHKKKEQTPEERARKYKNIQHFAVFDDHFKRMAELKKDYMKGAFIEKKSREQVGLAYDDYLRDVTKTIGESTQKFRKEFRHNKFLSVVNSHVYYITDKSRVAYVENNYVLFIGFYFISLFNAGALGIHVMKKIERSVINYYQIDVKTYSSLNVDNIELFVEPATKDGKIKVTATNIYSADKHLSAGLSPEMLAWTVVSFIDFAGYQNHDILAFELTSGEEMASVFLLVPMNFEIADYINFNTNKLKLILHDESSISKTVMHKPVDMGDFSTKEYESFLKIKLFDRNRESSRLHIEGGKSRMVFDVIVPYDSLKTLLDLNTGVNDQIPPMEATKTFLIDYMFNQITVAMVPEFDKFETYVRMHKKLKSFAKSFEDSSLFSLLKPTALKSALKKLHSFIELYYTLDNIIPKEILSLFPNKEKKNYLFLSNFETLFKELNDLNTSLTEQMNFFMTPAQILDYEGDTARILTKELEALLITIYPDLFFVTEDAIGKSLEAVKKKLKQAKQRFEEEDDEYAAEQVNQALKQLDKKNSSIDDAIVLLDELYDEQIEGEMIKLEQLMDDKKNTKALSIQRALEEESIAQNKTINNLAVNKAAIYKKASQLKKQINKDTEEKQNKLMELTSDYLKKGESFIGKKKKRLKLGKHSAVKSTKADESEGQMDEQ